MLIDKSISGESYIRIFRYLE